MQKVVSSTPTTHEIDDYDLAALARLSATGSTLLNWAVLLRGVNGDARVLAESNETSFAAGVLPYNLHLLDRVAGAAHFEVHESPARALWADISCRA